MGDEAALDPRWSGPLPFFYREPKLIISGDWDRFFSHIAHRAERLVLYGETGLENASYFGDCLVTASLSRFKFDRKQYAFHEAIHKFFSPDSLKFDTDAALKKDSDWISAEREFNELKLQKARNVSTPSAIPNYNEFFDPDILAARSKLDNFRPQRFAVCSEQVLSDRIFVLEALLKQVRDSPKGIAVYPIFRQDVRNYLVDAKINYDVDDDGIIHRHLPEPFGSVLMQAVLVTGDSNLDQILEAATRKFRDRDTRIHRESLEKLWDAWERLKTIESGHDKKQKAQTLFSKLPISKKFCDALLAEADELTRIGNNFMIRHSETDKTPVGSEAEVDYLFYRLFSLIWLLLSMTGRVNQPR